MGYAETLTVQDGRPLEDFELVAWDGSHISFGVISLLTNRLRSERQSREGVFRRPGHRFQLPLRRLSSSEIASPKDAIR